MDEELADWIAGFVDGEGTFSLNMNRHPGMRSGYQVSARLSVSQSGRDLAILQQLRHWLGVGNVVQNRRHDNHREDMFRLDVNDPNELSQVIVPLLDGRLQTTKRYDFDRFAKGVKVIREGRHLTEGGLREIAPLRDQMNRQRRQAEAERKLSLMVGPISPDYAAGFTDAEGNFSLSVVAQLSRPGRKGYRQGYQVQPRFTLVQHPENLPVLEAIRNDVFGGRGQVYAKPTGTYRVNSLEDLAVVGAVLGPRMRTSKRHDLVTQASALQVMREGRHLTWDGLVEIARLAEQTGFRVPRELVPRMSLMGRGRPT